MTDFWGRPDPPGVVLLHASAVVTTRGAVLFLGPSGRGKSTTARLVGAPLLADDKVYLILRAGRWLVADASERDFSRILTVEEVNAMEGIPLRAVCSITWDTEPWLERSDVIETCRSLLEAAFELYWQQRGRVETKKRIFAALAAVARAAPGYRLHSDRSPRIRQVLDKAIGL